MRCSSVTSDHGMSQLTNTLADCRSIPSLPPSVDTMTSNSRAMKRSRTASRRLWSSRPEYRSADQPTLALEAGVPAKVVSERLGHTGIAITLDLYTHRVDELHWDAAEAVAGLFRP